MKFYQSKIFRIFLLIVFSFLIMSCGKREDKLSNELFIGTWNWKSTTIHEPASTETPASTGIDRKIQMLENYQYTITENNQVKSQGTYSLRMGVTNTDHSEKRYLVFSNDGEKIVASIDASRLVLMTDGYDGGTYEYQK